MIAATLVIKGDNRKLGDWEFAAVPNVGDLVTLRINDEPVVFQVALLMHGPSPVAKVEGERFFPALTVVVQWNEKQPSDLQSI
jgi:hypothetical protein